MLEFCPAGESSTAVFAFLFLQRLPHEIRVLLSVDDQADMRTIAKKADRLIAMHVPQSHDSCAAVSADDCQEESSMVAAARASGSCKDKGHKCPPQKALGRRIDLSKRGQEQAATLRKSMCYYHAKFGEQAKFCKEGCIWKTRPPGR